MPDMSASRLLLIANPTAQSGNNAALIERARQALDASSLVHDFQPTLPDGATVEVVAGLLSTSRYRIAVSMGGDGTFAEVAKAILKSGRAKKLRMGMLPTGTANDQGKSFGMESSELSLGENVRILSEGCERKLDAGKITLLDADGEILREDLFFDSAGWGISPRVLQMRNEDKKFIESIPFLRDLWKGHVVYAGALLRTFLESYIDDSSFGVDIKADGKDYHWPRLTDLVVKATQVYGGGWIFDRSAEPDDGKFEVVPFTGKTEWIAKAIVHLDGSPFPSQAMEKIGAVQNESFSASQIEIKFGEKGTGFPSAGQIDGEEFPVAGRIRIEVVPRALRLIVPLKFSRIG
jgi:diacylglycerol kinase family enzyme